MAEQYDLDLDLLQPQPKHILLGGKSREVYPPKVKDLLALGKLVGQLSNSENSDSISNIDELMGILSKLMPSLKDDDVDLTVGQLKGLIGFLNNMVEPDENGPAKELGVKVASDVEKKTASA